MGREIVAVGMGDRLHVALSAQECVRNHQQCLSRKAVPLKLCLQVLTSVVASVMNDPKQPCRFLDFRL